ERGLQRLFAGGVVGQELQGGADQRVGLAELLARNVQAVRQPDVAGPGHEEAERDRLRVTVRELFVVRLRKEQCPPVLGQRRKGAAAVAKLLRYLVPEQPTKARGNLRQFLR